MCPIVSCQIYVGGFSNSSTELSERTIVINEYAQVALQSNRNTQLLSNGIVLVPIWKIIILCTLSKKKNNFIFLRLTSKTFSLRFSFYSEQFYNNMILYIENTNRFIQSDSSNMLTPLFNSIINKLYLLKFK